MLKPLELTVYPLELTFPAGYKLPRDTRITFNAANRMAEQKRLTNAELAAEYWRACLVSDVIKLGSEMPEHLATLDYETANRYAHTMHRFATLPHHDEEVTP